MFRAEKTMFRLQATSARLLGFLRKLSMPSAFAFLWSAVAAVDPVDSDLLLFLLDLFLLLLDGVDLGPEALVASL